MIPLPAAAIALLLTPLGSAAIGRCIIDFYHRLGASRPNYRGKPLPAALGPALLLGYLSGAAAAQWLGGAAPPFAVLFLWAGFAFLGLWDDLISEEIRGFKGHFGALCRGRLTAGFLKAFMALLISLLFAGSLPLPPGRRLAATLLILLSANALNLFDRRPGRALKVFFFGALLVIFLARTPGPAALLLLPLLIGALAVAPLDLAAAAMLGDCGANLLGAALGVGAVLHLPASHRAPLLMILVALHLFCEFSSLSKVIEKSAILRRLDHLGRFREKYG